MSTTLLQLVPNYHEQTPKMILTDAITPAPDDVTPRIGLFKVSLTCVEQPFPQLGVTELGAQHP
jgi:hypothetical protein